MEDRTMVEWDKDGLDGLGILKIDVLALGMLTCLRPTFTLLEAHYGRYETLASLPEGDVPTYDMICRSDTIGAFQVESRAQMTMLPRFRPRCYYDLVIEVAIVRPGPIQGDMVHPYLRRRQGLEPVSYPKEELRQVLGKTLGVPLFQEQVMNIAIVAAHFKPGEADRLRRAMATLRRVGTIGSFRRKMVEGMVANGDTSVTLPNIASTRSRASANTAFPKAMQGEFRLADLRFLLDEMPLPGRLLRRPAQPATHGLLRPGPDCARCP